jgi:pimeloyl-ACP methyl ester carboxylesterase
VEHIEVDGLRIGYERAGEGPLLLLLHGYVGDGPTTWGPQLDGLADEFTVVAWGAPGAGSSSDPPETFGMPGYADCLAAFVRGLGLGPPHVVGLSFGGALALAFHHRHPTVARTLVLASAYAGWPGSLPRDIAEQRLRQALELAALSPEQFVTTLLPTMFSPGMPAQSVDGFGAAMRAFHPAGFRAMARASAEDLREALGHVDVPTLLLYGDTDVRAPMAVAEGLRTAIRGSTLEVLPGAGHLCNLEAAGQFNREVRSFLRTFRDR